MLKGNKKRWGISLSIKKTILITGASGFIGQNLLRVLCQNDEFKIKTISKTLRDDSNLSYENFISHNFDKIFFEDVAIVIHLASIAHIPGFSDKDELTKVNVLYPELLLRSAINCKTFIFISSAGVKLLEKGIVLDTANYAESKLQAEKRLIKYNQEFEKTNLVILRPPMVYGNKAPGNFGKLIKLMSFPLIIPFGSMKMVKPSIHVENLVSSIKAVVDAEQIERYSVQVLEITDPFQLKFNIFLSKLKKDYKLKALLMPCPLILLKLFLNILGKTDLYNKLILSYELSNTEFEKKYKWYPPRNEFNLFQENK